MLNKQKKELSSKQIRLVQIATRKAGIRTKDHDGRYYLLLAQYKQSNGKPVTSCKQLTHHNLEDLLAICESFGWQCPGKAKDHFRQKIKKSTYSTGLASFAQKHAISKMADDLGWNELQLNGMLKRMTDRITSITELKTGQAYKVIEAMKAMLSRQTGISYSNVNEIKEDFEGATDGKKKDKTTTATG